MLYICDVFLMSKWISPSHAACYFSCNSVDSRTYDCLQFVPKHVAVNKIDGNWCYM